MPELDLVTRAWLALGVGPPRGIPPFHLLAKPLREARVALVTTGGFVPPGAPPFHTGKRGDPTFRVIPHGLDPASLSIHHPHYDHSAARRDVNVLFPYPLLQGLADERVIGAPAAHHYSFMGYIPLTRALEMEYAPQVAGMMEVEAVDATLLVPAWPTCNRSVGLIAREIEKRGIATICLMNLPKVAERIRAPRTLLLDREFGAIVGPPGDAGTQRRTVCAALQIVEGAVEPGEIRVLDPVGTSS